VSETGISVVTTTWNESENIKDLILSVRAALKNLPHEIIVVDDSSSDGTFQIAKLFADVAVTKKREGQTKGLLYGMQLAKYSLIVTMDADLENNPQLIHGLVKKTSKHHMVIASRSNLPRVSEKLASKTLGKLIGVIDTFSNFRVIRKEIIPEFKLKGGETFGAEFQVIAKKKGLAIGELKYDPPRRRRNPRIGGPTKANLKILLAIIRALICYVK
jgi:dolichol-phosphate mannosyltransferase